MTEGRGWSLGVHGDSDSVLKAACRGGSSTRSPPISSVLLQQSGADIVTHMRDCLRGIDRLPSPEDDVAGSESCVCCPYCGVLCGP